MNYTVEQTEQETILRFANPVTAHSIQNALEHFRNLEIIQDVLDADDGNIDAIEAAKLLTDIKRGIRDRTHSFLRDSEDFERLVDDKES